MATTSENMLTTPNHFKNEVGTTPSQPGGGKGKKPRTWRMFALFALIVLVVGGGAAFLIPYLHTTLPASTATVTLNPANKDISTPFTVTAVTGQPNASLNQVGARLLSSTTTQSVTVKATGKGHQVATRARGILVISQLTGTLSAGGYVMSSNSGVAIHFSLSTSFTSDKTLYVLVEAEKAGPVGNIPAYDFDGYYSTGDIEFYVQNPEPFTSGRNAYDYTFVQQSDIDGAASSLVSKLTPGVQSAVQKQVQAHELLVSDMRVTSKVSANHKANDRVNTVAVTVSVTSKAEVYKPQEVQAIAVALHKDDIASQLGANYVLVGDVVVAPPVVQSTLDDGTATFLVKTEGVWVYHFSDAQLRSLAQSITGKTQTDAMTLLDKQKGVQKTSLITSGGWGTALPTTPGDIKFNVVNVPGLQATSTS